MPRGVVRASLYLPAHTDGSRRLRGSDEDTFTMVAAALERLFEGGPVPAGPLAVRRLGAAADLESDLLAGILGTPVRPAEPSGGVPLLLGPALDLASSSGSGPELVVGAVLDAAGTGPTAQRAPSPGEGAYALLVDGLSGPDPGLLPTGFGPETGEELSALMGIAARTGGLPSPTWRGGWGADPREGLPGTPPSAVAAGGPVRVSEGAYLPPATYREGIASRWRFEAERCAACGTTTFPVRGRCRGCGRTEGLVVTPLPREGLPVVAVTWIGAGGQPTEFDDQVAATGPYGVALLELIPGVRATASLTDVAAPRPGIGSLARTELRRLYALDGAWRYGRKAIPQSGP